MPLTINTNMAASKASYYLSKNNDMLQKSLDRLSSGRKITNASDDAGGLAVSMKLEGSIDRLKGASNNVSNAISFLQVQDGLLESASNIVSRMGELKGLYADVLKSSSDQDTYNSEFNDLQSQLFQISQTKFNGVSLFSTDANGAGGGNAVTAAEHGDAVLGGSTADGRNAKTKSIFITEDGSSGATVSISQSFLLSAVTINTTNDATAAFKTRAKTTATFIANATYSLARNGDETNTFNLGSTDLDTDVFTKALENLATLRANNGGQVSRLQYAQENLQSQTTNLQAAVGRIVDVDIASETAELAKQQILVQASASMVAQANTANNVALMLLQ